MRAPRRQVRGDAPRLPGSNCRAAARIPRRTGRGRDVIEKERVKTTSWRAIIG